MHLSLYSHIELKKTKFKGTKGAPREFQEQKAAG